MLHPSASPAVTASGLRAVETSQGFLQHSTGRHKRLRPGSRTLLKHPAIVPTPLWRSNCTILYNRHHQQRRVVMAGSGVAAQRPDVDEADWKNLAEHLRHYDEQREVVIKRCRDVTKLSKQAIYSLHRGDVQKAHQQIASAETIARELLPIVEAEPTLRYGSYAAGIEELAEACIFRTFLAEDRLLKSSELPLANVDEYLGGVLDFTGELNRYAVKCATVRDVAAVARCTALVDALMGEFLKFDFRNTGLRRKFDTLKYTFKKLENTMYELSLAEATGRKLRQSDPELPVEAPAQPTDTGTQEDNDV